MYVANGGLSGILAWLEGYETATRSAFGGGPIPEHYDTSPMKAMDALARAAGIERNGRPLHFDLEKIINHFGSSEAVVTKMEAIARENRKSHQA
jgi:hypothetical protein